MHLKLLILLFVFALPAHAYEITLDRTEGQYFLQGEAITGRISGNKSVHRVYLESANGQRHARVNSFLVDEKQNFVLPLPYNLNEGRYTLSAESLDSSARLSIADIYIAAADYPVQEIHLNRVISTLRQTSDPRRGEESEFLWDILTRVNPDAVYHTAAFLKPVQETRISSDYAHQRLFIYDDGSSDRSVHWGVDFAAPKGSTVIAPGDGVVVLARDRLLTGYSILIEHLPGVYTLYYHLDRLSVEEGQFVEAGEVIGEVGSTGVSTGPHLHWELRMNAIPVNPLAFITRPLLDIRP